eukprot:scaffold152144_cov63-Attheya_sp.AAC.2
MAGAMDFHAMLSAPGAPGPPALLPPASVIVVRVSRPSVSQSAYPSYQFLLVATATQAHDLLSTYAVSGIPASFQCGTLLVTTSTAPAPAPSAVSPSLFNNAVLPHLVPGGGNAYSRLDDSLQAQQGQIPSAQGQSFSRPAVPISNGAYPNAYPQAQEFMASQHSTVPVPPPAPGGRTFTDAQIMELITNARQVHQPSAPRQYSSAHSMPHPSLPSVVCVGSIYHSTASLPAPHSSQASTVPLNPSVNNASSHSTVASTLPGLPDPSNTSGDAGPSGGSSPPSSSMGGALPHTGHGPPSVPHNFVPTAAAGGGSGSYGGGGGGSHGGGGGPGGPPPPGGGGPGGFGAGGPPFGAFPTGGGGAPGFQFGGPPGFPGGGDPPGGGGGGPPAGYFPPGGGIPPISYPGGAYMFQPPAPYYPAPRSTEYVSSTSFPKWNGTKETWGTFITKCKALLESEEYGNIGHDALMTVHNLKYSHRLRQKLFQSLPDVSLDHFRDNPTYVYPGIEMLCWLMEANEPSSPQALFSNLREMITLCQGSLEDEEAYSARIRNLERRCWSGGQTFTDVGLPCHVPTQWHGHGSL